MSRSSNTYCRSIALMLLFFVIPALSEACNELTARDRAFWEAMEKRPADLLFPLKPVSVRPASGAVYTFTEKGINAFLKGDFPSAERYYNRAIEGNPQEAALYHNLALIAFSRLEFQKASELWLKALSIEPLNARYTFHLAFTLTSDGKTDEAIGYYHKLLAMMHGRPEIYNSIGQLFEFKNDISGAESSFRKALSIKGYYAPALTNIANLYRKNNRLSEAIRVYKKLIIITPGDVDNYIAIGDIYNEMGKNKLAAGFFKKALAIRADYPEIHTRLAGLYKKMGRLREAVEEEKQAYAISCSLRPNME